MDFTSCCESVNEHVQKIKGDHCMHSSKQLLYTVRTAILREGVSQNVTTISDACYTYVAIVT